MKARSKLVLVALAAAVAAACATVDGGPPQTLRGSDAATADAVFAERAYVGRRPGSQQGYARTYSTQPPLIPHAVENFDEVTLQENQCLECHSPEGAKKRDAPPIGDKHFVAGSRTAVAQNRYACVMCHVPQADAPALVDNQFVGDRVVPAAQKK